MIRKIKKSKGAKSASNGKAKKMTSNGKATANTYLELKNKLQKITPCLWFDSNAEETVRFYTSIFKDSKVGAITHYGEASSKVSGMPKGSVLTVAFTLEGQDFLALNGGSQFKFSEAISLMINCDTQREIDFYWESLTQGGEEGVCGWLKDKYGLSWQVVPRGLDNLIQGSSEKNERAMEAFLKMKKINIQAVKEAYKGEPAFAEG